MTNSTIAVSVMFIITFGYVGNALLVSTVMAIPPNIFLINYAVTGCMTVLNSTINPVIYAFFLPVFRRGLRQVLCFSTCGKENDDKTLSKQKRNPEVAVISKYTRETVVNIE